VVRGLRKCLKTTFSISLFYKENINSVSKPEIGKKSLVFNSLWNQGVDYKPPGKVLKTVVNQLKKVYAKISNMLTSLTNSIFREIHITNHSLSHFPSTPSVVS
jgi:hypothetical protein